MHPAWRPLKRARSQLVCWVLPEASPGEDSPSDDEESPSDGGDLRHPNLRGSRPSGAVLPDPGGWEGNYQATGDTTMSQKRVGAVREPPLPSRAPVTTTPPAASTGNTTSDGHKESP